MAATADANAVGRPPKYKTPEDMQSAVDEYFENLPPYTVVVMGESKEVRMPTITGLALALGFSSRSSLYEYEGKPEFTDTIKKARMRVEHDYEMQLRTSTQGQAGTIFALKNLGWRDKQEQEISGELGITKIERTIVSPKSSDS